MLIAVRKKNIIYDTRRDQILKQISRRNLIVFYTDKIGFDVAVELKSSSQRRPLGPHVQQRKGQTMPR